LHVPIYCLPGSIFASVRIQSSDGTILTAHRWKTFILSTIGTYKSNAPIIPGPPDRHLAKIYFHPGINMFVLTWFDQDKSRVQISYNNGLNLLERSIEISTDDLIIIGRTYYQVKIISNDRIDFFPIKNPFRIDLIESHPFFFTDFVNLRDTSAQIVLPIQLQTNIPAKLYQKNTNTILELYSNKNQKKDIHNGETFSIKDQYENTITFIFAGQFLSKTILDFFQMSNSFFDVHERNLLYLFIFMMFLLCCYIFSNQFNQWSFPILMGTMLLCSMSVVFMFRLDVSCRQYSNITIDHIHFIYVAFFLLMLSFFSGKIIRIIRIYSLKKAHQKNPHQYQMIRKEYELIVNHQWSWPMYDSMTKGNWLHMPSILLFFSWIIFLFQWITGRETGFQLFGMNFQPVFLIIVMFAFVLAFGTSSDIVTVEKQVVGSTSFWWRYNDLIICLIFFIPGLLIIKDFAPIFVFFMVIICGWLLRIRKSEQDHLKYFQRIRLTLTGLLSLFAVFCTIYWIIPMMLPGVLQMRLATWIAPFKNTMNSGQYIDSLWLLKDAGINGFGLGASPEICGLSQIKDDFILSLILSELGVPGLLALMVSYGLIIVPAFQFSRSQGNTGIFFSTRSQHNIYFYRSLIFWLAMMFIVQIMSIVGMILGLIPVMGLPLPFMGRGGSSLITFAFMSIGIMIFSISELHIQKERNDVI